MMIQPSWTRQAMGALRPITSEIAAEFWDVMCERHHMTWATKKDDDFIITISHALDMMEILDADKFLTRYTTTLGERIYIPSDHPGDEYRDPLGWIILAAHEITHGLQFQKDREKFLILYLASPMERAIYEADATRTAFEILAWNDFRNVEAFDPRMFTEHLRDYALEQQHLDFVTDMHRASIQIVRQGGLITPMGRETIEWLNQRLQV